MMRFIQLSFFIIMLFSCSSKQLSVAESLALPVKSYSVQTGEVVRVSYPHPQYIEGASFKCKGSTFPAYYENGEYHAFIAETYFSDLQPFSCDLNIGQDHLLKILSMTVVDRTFPEEKLSVQPKKIFLSMKDEMRVRNEQVLLKVVFADIASTPLFDRPFILPLDSKITSHYGVRRVFNGSVKGQHLGIDFRAPIGIPVPVSNNGRVVFAGDLFYTGQTVIIDHGIGIFTVYGHLDSIKVELGEYVPRGAILGRAGATGRVSGPHLHWGVKVGGHYVDGASLIRETTSNQDRL